MPETRETALGLTAPQTAIWLDQVFHPGKPIYNTGQTVAISSDLDADLFVEALRQLARETDALGLALRMDGDAVRQSIEDGAERAVDRVDFDMAPDPTAAAGRWIEETFWRPIGWSDFPLFQFTLLRLGGERHVWLQKYHHLIVDATARRLITARAAQIYAALQDGATPPQAPGVPYARVIEAEETYRGSAAYAADRRYWLDRFAALPEPMFANDLRASDRARSGRPTRLAAKLERSDFERFGRLARSHGSSAFKATVALVHLAFSRLYGNTDIVFGVPLANRATASFRSTIGLFAQVMPFRIDIPRRATLAEALALIDAALPKDVAHRRFPFYELGSDLQLARKGRAGLYDISINFLATDYGIDIAGAPIEVTNLSSGFFTPWAITVADLGTVNGIDLIIDYDAGVVEAEAAAQLAHTVHFRLE
jgi:nonribosomal peptide synthetase DhbF